MKCLSVVLVAVSLCTVSVAHAQTMRTKTPLPVTIDLRNAPVRDALVQIFTTANLDYSIDPRVSGTVTLKVTDLPFESALKLVLRSSTTPLTYALDGGVYIVKPRVDTVSAPQPTATVTQSDAPAKRTEIEAIELTHADPVDFAQILNITMVPIFTRQGLGVPGATGILRPGFRTPPSTGSGTTPPAPGRPGGTGTAPGGNPSPPAGTGSGFGGLIGF